MAERSISVMTCDRCFTEEEIRRPERSYEWGRLTASQANGPIHIGGQYLDKKDAKDLCPECMKALEQWWRAPLLQHEGVEA